MELGCQRNFRDCTGAAGFLHSRGMKAFGMALAAACFGVSVFAGATIEGVVGLERQPNTPATAERYGITASSKAAKAESMQVVVYLEGDFQNRRRAPRWMHSGWSARTAEPTTFTG